MEFTVPQFIEKEARIVGPFTFKQFIFIGTAGGICLFLYFIIPSLFVFVVLTIVLLGTAFALALFKVQRTSLPVFIKNFFIFLFKPKIYLWKKKGAPLNVLKKEEKIIRKEKEVKKESPLSLSRGSRLKELFTSLETKQK